ncbi:MAG: tetratricopeptide repeat protein, partial [Candidatus Lokiarchaeota archaeon]|nr:tetratricopeptide repeat protein [Candidatus Lokiarchaeota archaeon]
ELDLKATKARNYLAFSAICWVYGDNERSINYVNESLKISEKLDHKPLIAVALNNLGSMYRTKGDLDNAMETWERSLEIAEKINYKYIKVSLLDSIIQGAIEKGEHKQAKGYLQILKEINEKEKTQHVNELYQLNKALVLKMSLRARDRADAEDILKEIIEEGTIYLEPKVIALLNLCDLLLTELKITGDTDILDELQQYISRLLNISEKIHSYLFMAETYLLQARLSLLTLSLKESKRFFTQAQQIAEKWGLSQLSLKISKEKEEFLKQMSKWEKLKETDAPINEIMELAQIDKQIERMLQNRSKLTGQIVEEKVDVHKETKICMICKGDVTGYIYLCECDAIYCENCVKALIDLENTCWVCETPIDQSRPIKHFKKDEVEIKKKITNKEDREPIKK